MGAPRSFLWLAIVILLLVFTVVAVEEASSVEDGKPQSIHMFPLTKRDLDEAFGLKKRSDDVGLASLGLADKHELFFGGLSDNGQIVLANMTLKAPRGQHMVMMEHFEEHLSNHDCHKDSGHMTLTFNSREAFKHALESWSHVNNDANKQFIMIANHDGCGPDFERQPYIITGIDHHEERMETRLTARSVSFPDTFDTYSLNFGKALPTKKFAHKLFKRFVGGPDGIVSQTKAAMVEALNFARKSIKDAGDALDVVDIDASRNYKTDISMGNPGELTNVFMDMFHKPSRIIVNCLDCFVRGTLEMSGFIEIEDGSRKTVLVQFVATNFRVKFDIESRLILVKVDHEEIVDIHLVPPKGVPGLSLNISNFLGLGLVTSWTAQMVPLFIGVANFTVGVDATIPDGANFSLINYPHGNSGSGLEGGTVDTHFNVRQSDAICKVVISSTPKLTLEADLHGVGKIESHAVLAYPEYGFDISPRVDKGGACEKELGAGTAGATISGVVDVTFNIITATMWRNKPFEITDWRIYFKRTPFLRKCVAFPLDDYEVGDSPAWLTETGFKSEEDGLPAEFTSASKGEQTNENANDREVAIAGSAAAAPRLKARSLYDSRPIRVQRSSREFL